MPKRTFTPEQIVSKLRQIQVTVSQGKTVPLACKEAGIKSFEHLLPATISEKDLLALVHLLSDGSVEMQQLGDAANEVR